MARRNGEDRAALMMESQTALGMLQVDFARFMGVSSRTARRWLDSKPQFPTFMLLPLVTAVHAKDPALAGRLATAHGTTLDALGVTPPPQAASSPTPPARDAAAEQMIADALVCAAAEVADVSPRAMRPALAAALGRARAAGLTIDEAHRLLAAAAPASPAKKGKSV